MKLNEIIALMCNIFLGFTIYIFMGSVFEEKQLPRWATILIYSASVVVFTVFYMYVHIPLAMIISSVLCCFMLTFQYKARMLKRIVITLLLYGIMVVSETVVLIASNFFIPSLTAGDQYASNFGQILIRIFSFLLVVIIKKLYDVKKDQFLPIKYWLFLCMVPISTSFMAVMLLQKDKLDQVMLIISLLMILAVNAATFMAYDGISRLYMQHTDDLLTKQQNSFYKNQLQIIKTNQSTIKSINHDMKNHLIAIRSLVLSNKSEAVEYIDKMLESSIAARLYSKTGNITFDSIVNYKLSQCLEKNIEVKCDITLPSELFISDEDMIIIIGNLLDNAMEAAEKCSEYKYVYFSARYHQDVLYITVDNTFVGNLQFENNRSIKTTKLNREWHGVGINNIKSASERYHGSVEQEVSDNMFSSRVILFAH